MIVVIADDLTGAAELGGLGRKYNLVTEITTNLTPSSTADLLIIATDTRSLSRVAAEAVIREVCSGLHQLQPAMVFKKVDSVLRGHVLAEIDVQRHTLHLSKALIVPANPGLGRTIVDGTYLLHGGPIHASSFSQDPEFPVTSSRVPHMLAAEAHAVMLLKHHESMPATGVVVGEVKEAADLAAWCAKIDSHTLVAGAAEFFTALLASRNLAPLPAVLPVAAQRPFLVIWGSTFHKSRSFVRKMKNEGFPVSYMPEALTSDSITDSLVYEEWVEDIIYNLTRHGQAGMAIDPDRNDCRIDALALRTMMGYVASLVVNRTLVRELLIEGGSTAAAVIRKLGIKTLYPEAELAPGVIRMSVKGAQDLYLTLKPGSYEWPGFLLPSKQVGGTMI
jgi:uncharacterized protein YgbK (DUF1537 family)